MSSTSSIFSTYKQGENRVTSTILAVLERLNTSTVTMLLQNLIEDSRFDLVKFENQFKSAENQSVPDGRIWGNFEYIIETKIKVNSIDSTQLSSHLDYLKRSKFSNSRLIVLTPDAEAPAKFNEIAGGLENVFWTNFDQLVSSIDGLLKDDDILLADREKFLLVELKTFIYKEQLLAADPSKLALVIPAKIALGFYKSHHAYVCQPNRSFQKTHYMAFYKHNKIYREVPKVLGYAEEINFATTDYDDLEVIEVTGSRDEIVRRLKELEKHISQNRHDGFNKIFILSKAVDQGTIILEHDIINDKQSYSGERRTAFVQGQRYVKIDKLKQAKTTTDLEK